MSEALGSSVCSSSPSRTGGRLEVPAATHSASSTSADPPFETQPPILLPRSQDASCSVTPNEVLLKISTQVFIPDYSSFYTATPIEQFRMTYSSFPDGSLIAPPFISEVRHADWTLLFSGMMLMLFTVTSIISADYIRRVRVKHKGLFYALLLSQLCGVMAFILTVSTILGEDVNCRNVLIAGGIFTELSSAILLSGILGVKAYRCLNDSKTVLSIIIVLQAISSTMTFLDLVNHDVSRRLSLTCVPMKDTIFFSLSTTLRFVLALFICLCFVYAVWKSEKLPGAQGRMSISLSGQVPQSLVRTESEGASSTMKPRGWWDYVPGTDTTPVEQPRATTWHITDDQGFVSNMRYLVGAWMRNGESTEQAKRKGSEATLVAPPVHQHRSKPSIVRFDHNIEPSRFSVASQAQSSTPSKARSLGPLMNRMRLFREVMRNELAYTALITLFNVIATILGLIGVFARASTIDPEVFIGTYWGILSLLVLQSFRRVVKRHEREVLLQHPSAWDPARYVEKAGYGDARQDISSTGVSPNRWRAQSTVDPLSVSDESLEPRSIQGRPSDDMRNAAENPFADFEFVQASSSRDRSVDDLNQEGGLPRDQLSRTGTLLPNTTSGQDRDQDLTSIQWTESLARDSVSRYSDNSSRPQSLFYLEKTR